MPGDSALTKSETWLTPMRVLVDFEEGCIEVFILIRNEIISPVVVVDKDCSAIILETNYSNQN